MGEAIGLRLPLTAFLLRAGVTPASVWSDVSMLHLELSHRTVAGWEPLDSEERELLAAAVPGDVVMGLLRRFTAVPSWQRFFSEQLGVPFLTGARESMSAALFCAIEEDLGEDTRLRWVVWTFGGASRSLRRGACDPRFGMLAALNLMVAPSEESGHDGEQVVTGQRLPQLRELRYRATAPYVRQSGNRAARDIPIEGFRVDQASDLISAVGGSNANPALTASTVLGGRSLQFRARVRDLPDLIDYAETAILWARRTDYRQVFDWIDHIRPVEDEATMLKLREQLATELTTDPERSSIDVLLPDDLLDVGEDRSIQYIALPRERGSRQGRMVLSARRLAAVVLNESGELGLQSGLDATLRFFDESQGLIGTATVLECLAADLLIGSEHYITYNGDFYIVAHDFVTAIDKELKQIPSYTLDMPDYRGETEPAYNKKAAHDHPDKFVLLDATALRIPGEPSGVEPCDLLAVDAALIHVKRKGKSSMLSHLFLQAANSCELLQRSQDARHQLHTLVCRNAQDPVIAQRIQEAFSTAMEDRNGPTVVFAFLGDWRGKTITSLPLFSRISLVHEARRITSYGYDVAVKMISHW